jgi:hypothetical protein
MVVHGGAWWCMVVHGGAWWCMVVHGRAWWCMVVHGGAWWCMVVHGGAWWVHGGAWWWCDLLSGKSFSRRSNRSFQTNSVIINYVARVQAARRLISACVQCQWQHFVFFR